MSTTITSERSRQQHLARQQRLSALENANRIRTFRAEVKRQMRAGEQHVDALLLTPPAELGSMKVGDLLMTVPKFGAVKVRRTLGRAGISPSKQVGSLSVRQSRVLCGLMGERA